MDPLHDMPINKRHVTRSYVDDAIPAGAVIPYAGSTAPPGWLMCDGSPYSQQEYPRLYNVIQSTYNTTSGRSAPASGMFRVPDLCGRTAIGSSLGSGTGSGYATAMYGSAHTLGTTPTTGAGGEEMCALAASDIPAHKHTIADQEHSHYPTGTQNPLWESSPGAGGNANITTAGSGAYYYFNGDYKFTDSEYTGITGTNSSSAATTKPNIMGPFCVLNYIIKT